MLLQHSHTDYVPFFPWYALKFITQLWAFCVNPHELMGEGNLAEVYTVGLKPLNTGGSTVPIKLGLGEFIYTWGAGTCGKLEWSKWELRAEQWNLTAMISVECTAIFTWLNKLRSWKIWKAAVRGFCLRELASFCISSEEKCTLRKLKDLQRDVFWSKYCHYECLKHLQWASQLNSISWLTEPSPAKSNCCRIMTGAYIMFVFNKMTEMPP